MAGIVALGAIVALLALLAATTPASAASPSPEPDRYDFANDCYVVHALGADRYIARSGDGYAATATSAGEAQPFFMKPPELGRYLFYGSARDFLAANGAGDAAVSAAEPSPAAEWIVDEAGNAFSITSVSTGKPLLGEGEFEFEQAKGCTDYPEVDVSATGEPATGPTPYGETTGLVDAHMHMMAFEFLGGAAHCGQPWHRYGAPYALATAPTTSPATARPPCSRRSSPARTRSGTTRSAGPPSRTGRRPTRSPTSSPITSGSSAPGWAGCACSSTSWSTTTSSARSTRSRTTARTPATRWRPCGSRSSGSTSSRTTSTRRRAARAKAGSAIIDDPFQARKMINDGKLAVVLGIEVSQPLRLRRVERRADLRPRPGVDRPPARRGPRGGHPPDGAGQQVRQRALRRRRATAA